MLGAWVGWDKLTQVMLMPRIQAGPLARYVVRAEPGRRDALMAEVEQKLSGTNPNRAITYVRSHTQIKERSYRADSRMVAFLSVLIGLMVSVTALGIVGLASFHVNVRRKQIGTRRAVGARRVDIIRYFMLENWLLTTGGVVAGTRARVRLRPVVELGVLAAALAADLRRGRRDRVVGAGSAGGVPAGAARGGDSAGDRNADGIDRAEARPMKTMAVS